MTKQEILALINAKIAGQGTNIDAGSALPGILSGILDLIPEPPSGPTYKVIRFAATFDDATGMYESKQSVIDALGFESENDFDAIMNGQANILFDGDLNWVALRSSHSSELLQNVVFGRYITDEDISFLNTISIRPDGKYIVGAI